MAVQSTNLLSEQQLEYKKSMLLSS